MALALLGCSHRHSNPIPTVVDEHTTVATAPQAALASIPNPPVTGRNPTDGAEIIYIPAGDFTIGSDSGADMRRPDRQAYLDGYWIYKNDVTVAQYQKFCQATGNQMPMAPKWGWQADHPMVLVSWGDAQAYCAWAHAALPTAAQWEKAARGTDGREYPWGNTFDNNMLWCSAGG